MGVTPQREARGMGLEYEPAPRDRMVLRRRPIGVAGGAKRARIREIQAELLAELQEIDAEIQRLADRRSVVVDGLRRCRDAISGPETPHINPARAPGRGTSRGLLVRGLRPPRRASKSISDALAVEVRQGRVERLRRGEFEATGCTV